MGRWKPGLGGRFVRNFFKRLEKRRWHWGADLLWVLQCGCIVWLRGVQYTSKNMCRYFRILVFFFEFGVMFLTRTHYQGHISWRQISSRELLPPFPCVTWVKASCSRKWFAGECRCDPSSLGGNPDAHLGWLTWVGQRRWRRWISYDKFIIRAPWMENMSPFSARCGGQWWQSDRSNMKTPEHLASFMRDSVPNVDFGVKPEQFFSKALKLLCDICLLIEFWNIQCQQDSLYHSPLDLLTSHSSPWENTFPSRNWSYNNQICSGLPGSRLFANSSKG